MEISVGPVRNRGRFPLWLGGVILVALLVVLASSILPRSPNANSLQQGDELYQEVKNASQALSDALAAGDDEAINATLARLLSALHRAALSAGTSSSVAVLEQLIQEIEPVLARAIKENPELAIPIVELLATYCERVAGTQASMGMAGMAERLAALYTGSNTSVQINARIARSYAEGTID